MKRLVTAAEMQAIDRAAIEERGIPGRTLMEAAGAAVAAVINEQFEMESGQLVVVLCGRGNNGGDGFVIARHLREAGASVLAFLIGGRPQDLPPDAAGALSAWEQAGGDTREILDDPKPLLPLLAEADLIVDAILGTGSQGAPRGVASPIIEAVNAGEVPVVSVDIPSGLDADTGEVPGACIQAAITVSLGLPKRGHFLFPGRSAVGLLEVVDIGIPEDLLESGEGQRIRVLEPSDLVVRLPGRRPDMHKGDRGRLLLVGGSVGLTGAICLAARAAVRAGAGLVTVGVPLGLIDVVGSKLTEAMSLPLPDLENRALSADAFEPIALFHTGRLSALAVGPGMGRHPSTRKLVRRILDEIPVPTVLDADGLHAFSGAADLLRLAAAGSGLVLTPHPGEFSSLTGVPLDDLLLDRFASASHWARRLESVLVLKGAPTLIADPTGETVYVNPTGSEALATGGTGDVLTGFIAGFLAQGVDPVDAATAGAFIHGLIADYLVEEWGSPYGLQAGDLIEGFPAALGELLG